MTGMYKSVGLYLFLMLMIAGPAMAGDTIVATGDDIVVYSKDIDVLKGAYEESGFETTPKEFMDAMLRVRLFAKEALALNLAGPLVPDEAAAQSMQPGLTRERLQKLIQLYNQYIAYIYEQYPVSAAAIESYYLAFPEKTARGDDAMSADFFRPDTLDGEMKKMIRDRLIQNRKAGLVADEFKRLCDKYHVKVLSGY
ncbi:MAG: hypothetical protein HY881_11740 [Deltaproteobacteria bacterium]|nr:hypothetical protein [Deltaproteobacteria bacterium]